MELDPKSEIVAERHDVHKIEQLGGDREGAPSLMVVSHWIHTGGGWEGPLISRSEIPADLYSEELLKELAINAAISGSMIELVDGHYRRKANARSSS